MIEMSKEEIESKLKVLEEEEALLRRRFNELQEKVQNAPGSHRPGVPPPDVREAEREVHAVVLALVELDRRRQELTVAASL
jgi:hypothetical protein